MPSQDEIQALRTGVALPAQRVIQLRSKGMHSIRFEFVVRLLKTSLKVDTLTIYWEHGHEFLLKPSLENASRRLVLGGANQVVGEFPDLWLLCYPDDEELKQSVDAGIENMIQRVRDEVGKSPP